jgi:tetratricopeptide (TPR) repeat protein
MAMDHSRALFILKPDYAEAHFGLWDEYSSRELLDVAIEQCLSALRLKPNDA